MNNLKTAAVLIGLIILAHFIYSFFFYIVAAILVISAAGVAGFVGYAIHQEYSRNTPTTRADNTVRSAPAVRLMRGFSNRAVIHGDEDGSICMIEPVKDPDGRRYTLEYQSTPDGKHAIAWCRKNPWGATPNAGADYHEGHVSPEGFLCLGSRHPSRSLKQSPYAVDYVIPRARYWCTAFSYFMETGTFPQP